MPESDETPDPNPPHARRRRPDRLRRRQCHPPTDPSDLLVLDADVSMAAANDPRVPAWLERARELDADAIVSVVTLAEVVRGDAPDATVGAFVAAEAIAGLERYGAAQRAVPTSDPHASECSWPINPTSTSRP